MREVALPAADLPPLTLVDAATAADARRNIVTRGIDVGALTGARFRIGDPVAR
jgi:MOSC domain-containing protein YiiM